MKNKAFEVFASACWSALASFSLMAQDPGSRPIAVSPGGETITADFFQSCPTFSWSAACGAASYRVAIFKGYESWGKTYEEMMDITPPVIIQDISGPALSWTLPAEFSLDTDSIYSWFVQALDASGRDLAGWSAGRTFRVRQEIRFVGIVDKLEGVLKSLNVDDMTIGNVLAGYKSSVREVSVQGGGSVKAPMMSGTLGEESDGNTFYGFLAGLNNAGGMGNVFIGSAAGMKNEEGHNNVFVGDGSGSNNISGSDNTFLGERSGDYNTGDSNTFIGGLSGHLNTAGSDNAFVGRESGANNSTGSYNTFVGSRAGYYNTAGTNSFLGYQSGFYNSVGGGNVFLGYRAGYHETNSNRLYIDNSSTISPLIYGEFDTNLLKINGNLHATGYLSLDLGATQISLAELNLLDGRTTMATGAADNDALVTKGYVDDADNGRLSGTGLTDLTLPRWDGTGAKLVDSLVSQGAGTVSVNGNLQASGYLSLNGGANQIAASELNILDGKTLATGVANNDQLVTKGYVDENDNVGGGGLTGAEMTDTHICKWDDANTRLVDSVISENAGVVGVNGRMGIGTGSPVGTFHILQTGLNATLLFQRADGAMGKFTARPNEVFMGTGTNHPGRFVANNLVCMTVSPNGYVGIGSTGTGLIPGQPLHMSSGAYCSTGGVWTNASSRVLKENIRALDALEAVDTLNRLNPVKYNYKADQTDQYVGFIAEDVPDLVASADRKGLSPMDIVAVLTKVIQAQQSRIQEQETQLQEHQRILPGLMERIVKLEKRAGK